MPLSSPLQQQWQTVCERLPESLPASSLSEQAKSVLAFSDFVQESITANPDWLAELENAPPQADEWRQYAGWLQTALEDVADEATLMRVLVGPGPELRQFALEPFVTMVERGVYFVLALALLAAAVNAVVLAQPAPAPGEPQEAAAT